MVQIITVVAAAIFAGSAVAHPGHDVQKEALERRSFIESKPRDVSTCSAKLKARGHTDRGIQRRAALAENIRAKRGLAARDFPTVLATDHESNLTGITPDTDPSTLFADASNCVLQPDVTEGPYWVSGELIRSDVRETQVGVDTYVYVQVVDTSTCEPLNNIYVDFWSCNSTGVYAGVVAQGNGDASDLGLVNDTALRGVQATDADGVAEFLTLLPGHYTGRTNHIHIMTHIPSDTTLYPNNTLGTNSLLATHVGQIFFDQGLIDAVEATAPYNTNTQPILTNEEDSILAGEASTSDPMAEYVLLGDTVEDGILSWVTIGVDTTKTIDVVNAAYVDKDGGHATGKSLGGFPGGGFPGAGGPPPHAARE